MKRKCEKVFILKKLYKELSSACKSMQHNNMNNAFTGSENITRNTLISILGGGALLLGGSAYGASADWTGAADDNWSEASNWSLSLVPNSAGTSVNFIHNDAVKIDGKTVSLGTATNTIGSLSIASTDISAMSNFGISGGTLNFDNLGSDSLISLLDSINATIDSKITTSNNLNITNDSTYGAKLTLNGTINGGGKKLTFEDGTNNKIIVNGAITNASSVNKEGVGSLTLNGANSFNGQFNFNAGTVAVGNNSAFGNAIIVLADGGDQEFDVSSGSRTLSNQVTLNDGFSVAGVGKTLKLNANEIATLTKDLNLEAGNGATLDFGSNFALQGSGAINKTDNGTLVLESKNNTFSGGLNIQQGAVSTATVSDTLTIGNASGTNHMLGTGDIDVSSASSILNINTSATGNVDFAGSTTKITDGATINVLGGGTTTLSGGTIDFGNSATKGSLHSSGSVVLGNTTLLNSDGVILDVGKDLTILSGSTSVQSGIGITMDSASAQNINGTGAITGVGALTKSGKGTLTVQSGITDLSLLSLTALDGTLDLGTATIATSTVNLGGGTLVMHQADQISPWMDLNLAQDTDSTLNFNGYDQHFTGVNSGNNSSLTVNMGGTGGSANLVALGTLSGASDALRIGGWEGNLGSSLDHVTVDNTLTADQLSSVWFQGFNQGAVQVGDELRPLENMTAEWSGASGSSLWGNGQNWVGGDTYNIPDHAGASVIFGASATGLSSLSLGGTDRTIGSLTVGTGAATGYAMTVSGGALILDSGDANTQAAITQTDRDGTVNFGNVQLNSDTVVTTDSQRSIGAVGVGFNSVLTGAGQLIVNGLVNLGQNLDSSNFSGDITLLSNSMLRLAKSAGTGEITIENGASIVSNNVGLDLVAVVDNALDINGDFSAQNIDFTHAQDFNLDGIDRTIRVNGQVTFESGTNFTGNGSLTSVSNGSGGGVLNLESANNTFGGGLFVTNTGNAAGGVSTSLTSDLNIGQLEAGHNYLGSGNITVSNGNKVTIDSHGYNTTLNDSTLTLQNNGRLDYLDGGTFTLASGVLDGGTASSKGTLGVSGDLIFSGTTLVNTPNIVMSSEDSNTISSTVGGTISGLGHVSKLGSGTVKIDDSITDLSAIDLNITEGTIELSRDNQITSSTNLVLNGGALDTDNYQQTLGSLSLLDNSTILMDNGGITVASRNKNANGWVDGKILTLASSSAWDQVGGSYLRFAADPTFTTKQLSNVAFTGYESGAYVSNSLYSGYWTLLPNGDATNEWNGATSNSDYLWSDAANWLAGIVPDAVDQSATIRDLDGNLNGKTIKVDGDYTLGHLMIEAVGKESFTLGGNGSLTFDDNTDAILHHSGNNIVTFAADVHLADTLNYIDDVAKTVGYLDWTGDVDGSGGINKTGTGTLRISGGSANSYTGGFFWKDASVIQINEDGSLFGTAGLTVGNGGAGTYTLESRAGDHTVDGPLFIDGNLALRRDTDAGIISTNGGDLTFTGSTTLTAGQHSLDAGYGSQLILDGDISGSGGIRNTGSGTLVLNGANNTFTGGVVLDGTNVVVAHDQGLGTGTISVTNGSVSHGITYNSTGRSDFLELSNELNLAGGMTLSGNINFDHQGTSTVSKVNDMSSSSGSQIAFGKDHILDGAGGFNFGRIGSYTNSGSFVFLGENTFSGGVNEASGQLYVGADSVKDASGNIISGALGTGAYTSNGGWLGAYSETGSGITSRRMSNLINLNGANIGITSSGDAKTLIWDTSTIDLSSTNMTLSNNTTLSVESQFVDNQTGKPSLLAISGAGTLELKNGDNQISGGIKVGTLSTLLTTATGDVTTGAVDQGHNYFGTGHLNLDNGLTKIVTTDGSTVRLSGDGMSMNNNGRLAIEGGANTITVFDGNSAFTGTNTTGSITTSGKLIKKGAGTTTSVGAKLITPELLIEPDAVLSLTNANLVSGVGTLTLNGGTLAVNGLNQTFSTATQVVLNADSHIDFGDGASIVTVGSLNMTADGKYVGRSDLTLNLDNWDGNASSGGGADQFVVLNGLTDNQKIQNIWFTGGYAPGAKALINPNGRTELVPVGLAYVWDDHANNDLWSSSNWTDIGSPNGAGDSAVFDNTDANLDGSTISLGRNTTIGSISFESDQGQAFTLSGGTITLDSGDVNTPALIRVMSNTAPTIASQILLQSNLNISEVDALSVLNLTGTISGPFVGITKTGFGTLGLMSADSNYTNGTTIEGGLLQVGASSSLDQYGRVLKGPAGLGVLTLANGSSIEAAGGNQTLHNGVVFNGNVGVMGANTLTLQGSLGSEGKIASATTLNVADAAGALTFGSDLLLTGTENLTKTGSGTVNFNSTATNFSGNVLVNQGSVGIGTNKGFGQGSVSLANGTTLVANTNGLAVDNNISLAAGTESINSGAHNLTLTGDITGAGTLNKTGSGTLTLDTVSTYSGGTSVSEGAVVMTNNDAAGAGNISIASGAALNANFSGDTLSNVLTGAGNVNIKGTDVKVAADNSGFSGVLDVNNNASAIVNDAVSLGQSSVALSGNGELTIAPADADFIFDNQLSGSGLLTVDLGGTDHQFNFGANTGSAFTGTADIAHGIANLDANASTALANATLKLEADSKATMTGNVTAGNTTLNGGSLLTTMNSSGVIDGKITTNTLTLNSGSVQLDLAAMNSAAGLLLADDGVTNQLIAATTIAGDVKNLQMVDGKGAVMGANSVQNITQGGNVVAKGNYSESLASTGAGGNGLYVSYQLDQVDLQDNQTLSLNEGTATNTAAELKAKLTGAGNLDIAATNAITISGVNNTYTGTTTVSSGTAKAGGVNVFASSKAVDVKKNATLDLNSNAQQLNNLTGAGNVLVSAGLTANNTADSTFSGVLNGTSSLTKTGSGKLTLSGDNTLGGTTQINAGTLALQSNKSVGTSAVSVAAGSKLDLAFSKLGFSNTIAGNGTVDITGTDVGLTGVNTLAGMWNIVGSAAVTAMNNLGTAGVNLSSAASILNVTPAAGNIAFGNKLTGNGTLNVQLADNTKSFDFTSAAGNAFTGTVDLKQTSFALKGDNTTALTNATLKADKDAIVTVGSGNQQIGGLTFAGGKVIFDATIPAQTQANGIITAKNIDINGAGTVQVTTPTLMPTAPSAGGNTNILSQDDSGAITKLAGAGAITGAGGALTLVDQNGKVISNGQSIDISSGGKKVATGVYDYRLNTGDKNDGMYVSYALKSVDVIDGETLSLTPDTIASGLATDMSATITGKGNLDISAGAGHTVSLTNASNAYTGKTTVTTGTLAAGSNNAFGKTSLLDIAAAATADLNGYNQTVGSFSGATGSTLNVHGGTLSMTNGGTSDGALTGAGQLNVNGGDFSVKGANTSLSSNVSVASGASATLNNVAGLGNTGTVTTAGKLELNNASGVMAKNIAGSGSLDLTNGSNVTVTGTNTLSGAINIAANNSVTASRAANLGTATINNTGGFILDTATNWTFTNALTGAGLFTKNGTGNLTISRANNRTGSTNIAAGKMTLTDKGALGTGVVNVNTAAGNSAQGLNLAFGTAQSFASTLAGAGVTSVTGAGTATITGANSAYTGNWNISGKAAVDAAATTSGQHLGTGAINLVSGGALNTDTTGAFAFNNLLTGNGTLNASNAGNAFSFGSGVGHAFTGTVALTDNTFSLSGDNTATLAGATLSLGAGNVTKVGNGVQNIGNLTLAGGRIDFSNTTIPTDIAAKGSVSTGVLDVTKASEVSISAAAAAQVINPAPSGTLNLMSQDDDAKLKLIDSTSIAAGSSVGNLKLVDAQGNAISAMNINDIIEGGNTVAIGTYDYTTSFGDTNDGLYVGYGLKKVDLQAGQSLTLTPEAGATGAAMDFSTQITGTGNLAINAGVGRSLSLSNNMNDFTGETVVQTGDLKLAADDVLGKTANLAIDGGASVDMNGRSQTIGALAAYTGSVLNLDGTLTISDSQRSAGDVSGGFASDNTLFGNGKLVIDPSVMSVAGTQLGFTGQIDVTGGSQLFLNTAEAFNNAQGITLTTDSDKVTFANLSAQDASWTSTPDGISSVGFSGLGSVELRDGSNVALTGDSSAFEGQFDVAKDSTLTADESKNLGTADLLLDGTFNANTETDWTFSNNVTGNGEFNKLGSATFMVDSQLSGFSGNTTVSDGVMMLGNRTSSASTMAGDLNINANGTFSGIGAVNGSVNNEGRIVSYNVLPLVNGGGDSAVSNLTVGSLTNSGLVQLAGQNVGNSLTVKGDLIGAGGTVAINTVLGNDASATDKLILDGGKTTGTTSLAVFNNGGAGAKTDIGIEVVDAINGAITENGSFTLSSQSTGYRSTTGTLAIGAYDYGLVRGGKGGDAESWYLSSTSTEAEDGNEGNEGDDDKGGDDDNNNNSNAGLRPEAGIYAGNMLAAQSMFEMTLHDRESYNRSTGQNGVEDEHASWARVTGSHSSGKMANGALSNSADISSVQMGVDLLSKPDTQFGSVYAGVMGGWGSAKTYAKKDQGNHIHADGSVSGYSAGVYGTWYEKDKDLGGAYVDSWIQHNWFDNSVHGFGLPEESYGSQMDTVSVETGYAIKLSDDENTKIFVEPQGQLKYSSYRSDNHTEVGGTKVSTEDAEGVTARAGARLYGVHTLKGGQTIRPFVEVNYWYTQNTGTVVMNDDAIKSGAPKSYGEVKAGVVSDVTRNLQVTTQVGGQSGDNDFTSLSGQIGIKYSW